MTIKVRVLLSLSLILVSTRLSGQFVTKQEDKQIHPPKNASLVASLLNPSATGGVSREGILYKEIVPPRLALSDRYTNKPDIDVATAEALAVGRAKYLWGGIASRRIYRNMPGNETVDALPHPTNEGGIP